MGSPPWFSLFGCAANFLIYISCCKSNCMWPAGLILQYGHRKKSRSRLTQWWHMNCHSGWHANYNAVSNCCIFSVGTCPLSGPKRSREEEEAHARRAAEREGRRTRRRRAREMKSGSTVRHVDGMSSDDEMTELEATAFRNQKGKVGRVLHCFLLQVNAVDCLA